MRNRTIVSMLAVVCAVAVSVPIPIPIPIPGGWAGGGSAGVAHAADGDTTRFTPLPTPLRQLDTRESNGALGIDGSVTVQVTGDAPLPPLATTRSVILNVTVVGPASVGFWTVFPTGTARPTASNVNVDERWSQLGDALAMANLVTVPVGTDGTVTVFSQRGGHVIVDMLGSYETSGATAAGRFVPLPSPVRAVDTRSFLTLSPSTTTEFRIPGGAGAGAAVLNVTTIATNAGYWTVFPANTTPPTTANLNSLYPLHTASNQVIVPLDPDGDINVYTQSGGHLVIDVVGLMTGAAAPVSTDGLFVALPNPTRFLDTRVLDLRSAATNPLGGAQMPLPGWNLEVPVASNPAIGRTDVAAVVVNVTVTDSLAGGYVSLTPAGTNDPAVKSRTTSTVNVVRAVQTLPNHATVGVSARGFDVFTQSGGHLLADVAGYYLGSPVAAPFGAPVNATGTPFGCVGYPTTPVSAVIAGSSKPTVARGQQRLLDFAFWLSAADGSYGLTTSQAVMAFQKWSNLPASGVLDENTAAALNRNQCRPAPTRTGADMFVVDKGEQLGWVVRGARAEWILNVSTGGDYRYVTVDKRTGAKIDDVAITRSGTFDVYRTHDEVAYEGSLGTLYRPRFVVGGIAVHGYTSVPNYPASHGCIRVTNAAMDMLWATNAMPMRSTVIIHD